MVKKENKILIVEDEEPILRVLVDQFVLNGFQVLEAKDGEKGLSVAEDDKPDLIILDLFMPKMDGVTMLKKLRESGEWGEQVPVIIVTNFINRSSHEEVMSYNVLEFIVKTDLKIKNLIEKVKYHLRAGGQFSS